jgi:hypothetical protein
MAYRRHRAASYCCKNPRCGDTVRSQHGYFCPSCQLIGRWAFALGALVAGALVRWLVVSRGLKKPPYKGKFMPSFAKQHERSDKPVLVWMPGTQSSTQQKRNLRNKARIILDSTDRRIQSVGARVLQSVAHEPDPEFALYHLVCVGLDMSQETGEAWATCMTYLMDKFDKIATASEETQHGDETKEGNRTPSLLRRLFRTAFPRRFRARDEASPEEHVDQPSGAVDGDDRCENRSRTA